MNLVLYVGNNWSDVYTMSLSALYLEMFSGIIIVINLCVDEYKLLSSYERNIDFELLLEELFRFGGGAVLKKQTFPDCHSTTSSSPH